MKKKLQKIHDSYKEEAFESISVPVIRIKSKEAINDHKFIKKLEKYIEF